MKTVLQGSCVNYIKKPNWGRINAKRLIAPRDVAMRRASISVLTHNDIAFRIQSQYKSSIRSCYQAKSIAL